jgi:hypothetical protein
MPTKRATISLITVNGAIDCYLCYCCVFVAASLQSTLHEDAEEKTCALYCIKKVALMHLLQILVISSCDFHHHHGSPVQFSHIHVTLT